VSVSAHVTDLLPSPSVGCVSVGRSVCLSVCPESVLQNVIWIQMPFGMVSGVGQGMGVLDGVVIVEGKGAVLG